MAWQVTGPITNPTVIKFLDAMQYGNGDLTLLGWLVTIVALAILVGAPVGIFYAGRWIGETIRNWRRDYSQLRAPDRRRRRRDKDIRLPPRGLAQR